MRRKAEETKKNQRGSKKNRGKEKKKRHAHHLGAVPRLSVDIGQLLVGYSWTHKAHEENEHRL